MKMPQPRLGQSTIWTLLAFCAIACSHTAAVDLPPPVPGLMLPSLAAVGQTVQLSATTTAIAAASNGQTAVITRFRFAVADGTPAVELAEAATSHVFTQPGHYAVELTVFDNQARSASVQASIEIVNEFETLCLPDASTGCDGAPCLAGACAVLACAGDAACPTAITGAATHCWQGNCVVNLPAQGTDDAWTGDPGPRLEFDSH